jgi:hypothetical protein
MYEGRPCRPLFLLSKLPFLGHVQRNNTCSCVGIYKDFYGGHAFICAVNQCGFVALHGRLSKYVHMYIDKGCRFGFYVPFTKTKGGRVARWFIFRQKIIIWVHFGGSCNVRCWCILCHLVYFTAI